MRTILNCLALVLVLSGCSKFSNQLNGDEKLEALIEAEIQATLSANLGMKVSIAHRPGQEAGTLSIAYGSLDELDELCRILSLTQKAGSI